MSYTKHDDECIAYPHMQGKCEECVTQFLEWQGDGLLAILEGLADALEEQEERD